MMKCRTVFLSVFGIKRIGNTEVTPACIFFRLAHRCAALGSNNIKKHILTLVFLEIKRHCVIYL